MAHAFRDSNVDLTAMNLRDELNLRGLRFAASRGLSYEQTDGTTPGIIFGCGDDRNHGNFHTASYQAICDNKNWLKRLQKVHTASKRMRTRANWQWKELDCASSSDALLMNIFCYPGVVASARVCGLLGLRENAEPEFGFKPRTPLWAAKSDNTEVDMRIGDLLVEAKLTESGFQSAKLDLIARYKDVDTVFDVGELPMLSGRYLGYQLVRGALAAYATGYSFCVCCDARRLGMAEMWYQVLRAVRSADLRCRLKLLTWQELAAALPGDLQAFLEEKYGILPIGGR